MLLFAQQNLSGSTDKVRVYSLSAVAGSASGDIAAQGTISATASAALTTGITLAAQATASGTASAALTTAIQLAAQATASGTASAALTTSITLAAQASASVTVAADLLAGSGSALAAAATASVTASAALTTAIKLAAQASASVQGTATLEAIGASLAAQATATAQASASLTTAITLHALGTASLTASAAMSGGSIPIKIQGLRKTRYTPGRVPAELAQLAQFLQSEIERITDGLESPFTHQLLEQLTVEPSRKPTAQALVAYADGTNWNPGGGEGIYAYYSGAWNKLG